MSITLSPYLSTNIPALKKFRSELSCLSDRCDAKIYQVILKKLHQKTELSHANPFIQRQIDEIQTSLCEAKDASLQKDMQTMLLSRIHLCPTTVQSSEEWIFDFQGVLPFLTRAILLLPVEQRSLSNIHHVFALFEHSQEDTFELSDILDALKKLPAHELGELIELSLSLVQSTTHPSSKGATLFALAQIPHNERLDVVNKAAPITKSLHMGCAGILTAIHHIPPLKREETLKQAKLSTVNDNYGLEQATILRRLSEDQKPLHRTTLWVALGALALLAAYALRPYASYSPPPFSGCPIHVENLSFSTNVFQQELTGRNPHYGMPDIDTVYAEWTLACNRSQERELLTNIQTTFQTTLQKRLEQGSQKLNVHPCWRILGLADQSGKRKPLISKKEVTEAYRTLSKKHHPDKGGSNEAFRLVSNAHDAALKLLQR